MTSGEQGSPEGADEFVLSDLMAATSAHAGGPDYLQGSGQAVLDAVERLTDERGHTRVDLPLFETMKSTARHLHRPSRPSKGCWRRRGASMRSTRRTAALCVIS